jgi:hypothetical protein
MYRSVCRCAVGDRGFTSGWHGSHKEALANGREHVKAANKAARKRAKCES